MPGASFLWLRRYNCKRQILVSPNCSRFTCLRLLLSRRWTHADDFDGDTIRPGAVVMHLMGDIPHNATRPNCNGVIAVELGSRAYQHGPFQNCNEPVIRMRMGLTPIVGAPFKELDLQTGLCRIAK